MDEDQLFEWEGVLKKERPRPEKYEAHPVPWEPPWRLLGRGSRVVGFHYPQSTNEFGSVVGLCGVVGRPIHFTRPERGMMVPCADCVAELEKGRRVAQ